jgi:ankyrin repeat protein
MDDIDEWNNGDEWNNNNGQATLQDDIMDAIREDDAEELEDILLEERLDPNMEIDGFPLLSYALVPNTHPKVVAALISLGADPNRYFSNFGYEVITPLMYAAEELNPTAVRILLNNGADPLLRSRDKYRKTAYDMLANHLARKNSKEIREKAEKIADMLRPVTPKRLAKAKLSLKSDPRSVMGSLAVRGRLPANVVRTELFPFLGLTRKRRGSSKSPKRSKSPKGTTRRASR